MSWLLFPCHCFDSHEWKRVKTVFILPSFSDSSVHESSFVNVWLNAGTAARSQQVSQPAGLPSWYLMVSVPTMVASSSIFFMPGGFQKRPRVADDAPPLSPPPHPPCVSLPFFQRNGANVQPCGQLTGRLGPYANLMTAETIVSSARCRKCVVRRCTYSNPDLCWIIDDQQGQGLLLVLPCGTLQGSALHVHS